MIRAMQPIHWTLGQHTEPDSPRSAASHGHLSVVGAPFFRRGTCTNAIALQQDIVDRALLGLIAEVLDAPMVDRAVDKRWLGSGAGGRSTWTAVPEVERELSLLVTKMDRLMDALAEGTAPKDEIIARLTRRRRD